jgi:cell division inhibitor SulA/protein ImuA
MPGLAAALESHPGIWRGGELARSGHAGIATGYAALDAELPGGGWPGGALTELLPQHEGIGELRLLGHALAGLARAGKSIAWIAPPYLPYAPALAAAGIDLARVVIVKTSKDGDTLWAMEQALASAACGGVLAWPRQIHYTQLRRLQLAAEGGCCLALLFRPPQAAREPTPAALRIALATDAGGLALSILKRRGAPCSRPILLPASLAPASGLSYRAFDAHVVDSPAPAAAAAGSIPARLALA